VTPTSEFCNFLVPDLGLGRISNRASHACFRWMTWPLHRAARRWRRRAFGTSGGANGTSLTVLNSFSPHVLPRPLDWPEWAVVTGFFFLPLPVGWSPPFDLLRFLESGPPPLYIGFGSMSRNPERATRIALEAIARSGLRAVMATGWGGLRPSDVPADVHVLDSVPHAWLFPRVTAVVHHGGAGTVAAGLRAGKPTVCCPFFGDQTFWSDIVHRLGVGPRPVPQQALSAERLAAAILQATSDVGMRIRAERLGQQISQEDGVGRAVRIIESRLARAGHRHATAVRR